MNELPYLNPEEHANIESWAGRELTNEEAQLFLRERVKTASLLDYMDGSAARRQRIDNLLKGEA